MKRFFGIISILFLISNISACSKKQDSLEDVQEPLSIEISPESSVGSVVQPATEAIEQVSLPPQGPYKPTNQQIQAALKNAGYYAGEVDGKIGPQSSKAIKDFQEANGLKVDGKVGPATWAVLGAYLEQETAKKKSR